MQFITFDTFEALNLTNLITNTSTLVTRVVKAKQTSNYILCNL